MPTRPLRAASATCCGSPPVAVDDQLAELGYLDQRPGPTASRRLRERRRARGLGHRSVHGAAGRDHRQRRYPEHSGEPARKRRGAAVRDRRLHGRLRDAAHHRRAPRFAGRPQAAFHHWPHHVHIGIAALWHRPNNRRTHSVARGARHRSGGDGAANVEHHPEAVHRREPHPGVQCLRSGAIDRRRDRPGARRHPCRPQHRPQCVAISVLRQRADRGARRRSGQPQTSGGRRAGRSRSRRP